MRHDMLIGNLLRGVFHASFLTCFSCYLYSREKFHCCPSVYLCVGRFIAPIVGELSKKYPHVTTYKIDIDQVWNIFGRVMHGLES